jgi:hypothetical protein
MNFAEILSLVAVSVFLLVLLLLRLGGGLKTEVSVSLKPRRRRLFNLYCAILLIFGVLSVYYAIMGERPFIWFGLFGLIGAVSLYFGSSLTTRQRGIASFAIVFFAIIQSLMPIIENRGVVFGPDQWRDVKVTTYLMNTGSYQNAPGIEAGFYGFIPLFNVLNASVTETIGVPPSITFIVVLAVLSLISAAAFYALLKNLTGNTMAAIIAVLFFVSVPRLSLTQSLPSTASLSLGLLLLLLLLKGASNRSLLKSVLFTVAIMVFTVSVFHPVGMIPILAVCLTILVLNMLVTETRLPSQTLTFVRSVFIISLLISVSYWSVDAKVFSGVVNPLIRFFNTLTTFGHGTSIYSPQYFSGSNQFYSIAWAVPVSFSAAFLITFLWNTRNPTTQRNMLSRFSQHFLLASSLAGLLLVGGAFISILASPGASVERYINGPAYTFLVFPSSIIVSQLLSNRKKAIAIIAIIVFSASLVVGASSPDWAPFENPAFGAVRFSHASTTEANTLVKIVPNNTRLYEDHDIPLSELSWVENVSYVTDRSYQTTRNVVQLFKQNALVSFDPTYGNSTVVIKTDEITDQNIFNKYINIAYSSGRHVVFYIP